MFLLMSSCLEIWAGWGGKMNRVREREHSRLRKKNPRENFESAAKSNHRQSLEATWNVVARSKVAPLSMMNWEGSGDRTGEGVKRNEKKGGGKIARG